MRVFSTEDYYLAVKHHREGSSLLCLSGLVRCEDDPRIATTFSQLELINMRLYLPYIALLLTFILGHFILTSQNYHDLMD